MAADIQNKQSDLTEQASRCALFLLDSIRKTIARKIQMCLVKEILHLFVWEVEGATKNHLIKLQNWLFLLTDYSTAKCPWNLIPTEC